MAPTRDLWIQLLWGPTGALTFFNFPGGLAVQCSLGTTASPSTPESLRHRLPGPGGGGEDGEENGVCSPGVAVT